MDSRHDGGDGEELSNQISQVAVHEYKQGLNFSDFGGESCCESSDKTKEDAETHAAEAHHKESCHSQKYVHRFHHRHLCHKVKHVVQHL